MIALCAIASNPHLSIDLMISFPWALFSMIFMSILNLIWIAQSPNLLFMENQPSPSFPSTMSPLGSFCQNLIWFVKLIPSLSSHKTNMNLLNKVKCPLCSQYVCYWTNYLPDTYCLHCSCSKSYLLPSSNVFWLNISNYYIRIQYIFPILSFEIFNSSVFYKSDQIPLWFFSDLPE